MKRGISRRTLQGADGEEGGLFQCVIYPRKQCSILLWQRAARECIHVLLRHWLATWTLTPKQGVSRPLPAVLTDSSTDR